MNKWLYRAAGTAGIASGFLLLGGGVARADEAGDRPTAGPQQLSGALDGLLAPLGDPAAGTREPGQDTPSLPGTVDPNQLGAQRAVDTLSNAGPRGALPGGVLPGGVRPRAQTGTIGTQLPGTGPVGIRSRTGDTTSQAGRTDPPPLSAVAPMRLGKARPAPLLQNRATHVGDAGRAAPAGKPAPRSRGTGAAPPPAQTGILPPLIGDAMSAERPDLFGFLGSLAPAGRGADPTPAVQTGGTVTPARHAAQASARHAAPARHAAQASARHAAPARHVAQASARPAAQGPARQAVPARHAAQAQAPAAGAHRAPHAATPRPVAGEDAAFS